VSVRYRDPFLGKMSGLAHRHARCDEETGCSADYDEPRSTGLLDAFDEPIRSADDLTSVVRRRSIGRDDGVRVLDDAGGLSRIAKGAS
jgi:hypothetical protein